MKPPRLAAPATLRFLHMPASASASQNRVRPSAFWDSPAAFLLGTALLLGALFAAYSNTFHVPFLLDDADSIELNPTIKSLDTAWLPPSDSGITTSGRPLLNVSLAINYALHGTSLPGYHIANLFIHALAALVLWAVVRRTLRQPSLAPRFAAHATPLAWCAAALWALHPLQTESVTYIVQRAESLVGLFYLLTLYSFIRATETPPAGTTRSRLWPALTIFFSVCGMASKEVMSSAPLILFLYDRTFLSGSFSSAWKNHRNLHLSLAATWLVLLACILQSGGRGNTVGYAQIAWWEYAITQAPAIAGYLWRSIWPANLIFDYGAIVIKDPAVIIPTALLILALLGLAIYALRRHPSAGFCFAWFFLILAPTSSIVPVATQTAAEHRMYLPLAAIAIPAAIALFRWLPRAAFPALAVLLLAATLRTHARNHDYRSGLALWEDTVARVPDNPRALNNHGAMISRDGRPAESLNQFQKAITLLPAYDDAWHNLGTALLTLGRPTEAIAAIERAVNIVPGKAGYHASLGNAFFEAGQLPEALETYTRAHDLAPDVSIHAYNLGNTFLRIDRVPEALAMLQRAFALAPSDTDIVITYATALRRGDRPAEAIPLLEAAIRQRPDSVRARTNLGICYLQTQRASEGIQLLETVIALDPQSAPARYQLGSFYAENGRPADALPHFEALIHLRPPTAEILDNLGTLYAQTGRYDEAVATLKKALDLDPQHRNARHNLEAIQTFLQKQNSP